MSDSVPHRRRGRANDEGGSRLPAATLKSGNLLKQPTVGEMDRSSGEGRNHVTKPRFRMGNQEALPQ